MTTLICANCEEPVTGDVHYHNGEPYCCPGCIAGGPCTCTYRTPSAGDGAVRDDTAPDAAYAGPAHLSPGASMTRRTAGLAESRSGYDEVASLQAEPAERPPDAPLALPASVPAGLTPPRARTAVPPSAGPGTGPGTGSSPSSAYERQRLERPAVLRVDGLRDQHELLTFASELEGQAEVRSVTIVRGQLDDCWFSVQTGSVGSLMQALGRLNHFETRVRSHPAGVDVVVRYIAPAPEPPAVPDDRLGLLAGRPRMRVVQPGIYRETVDAPRAAIDAAPAGIDVPSFATEPTVAGDSGVAIELIGAPLEAPAFPEAGEPIAEPQRSAARYGASLAVPAADAPSGIGIVQAEDRPGGAAPLREHLTLVVYPFRSFVVLNEFQDAVRELRGVTGVKVRRFYRGTLHLGIDYEDVLPFTQRLREINQAFDWSLVSESSQEIEIQLAERAVEVTPPGIRMAR